MEHSEIIHIWKTYDRKLEDTLTFNRQLTQEVTKLKTKSLLQSMRPIKLFTLLVGIAWVGLGSSLVGNLFLFAYPHVSHFFLYSAVIQLLLTAIALVIYIYQLVLIQQIDISKPVLNVQTKIAQLTSSTLWSARILFLQLPVWTTFYLSETIYEMGNKFYIIVNGIVTLLFTFLSVWLFLNIKYENREKKWFKLIFRGKEWTPVITSLELCKDIEEFKQEIKE